VPPGHRRSTVEASDGGGGERATPAASNNGWRYSYPYCYSYG